MTQIEIDKIRRLQKLQNMLKIKQIMKTTNEAVAEILVGKDLNLTDLNHFIYTEAVVITEEIHRTGSNNSETQSPKTPPRLRRIQESIRGELSALAEIKRDDRKTQNMRRKKIRMR
jgi:hypothetical protein